MKNTSKLIIAFAGVAVLSAAAAAAAVWWYAPHPAAAAAGLAAGAHAAAPLQAKKDKPVEKTAKYLTVDKVIVMLRRDANEAEAHYLSTDLVLAIPEGKEKIAKEHLPLLRSIAVRALSGYTMRTASAMTVEQYAEHLNHTFDASYAKEKEEKPFTEVMIGKLIIE